LFKFKESFLNKNNLIKRAILFLLLFLGNFAYSQITNNHVFIGTDGYLRQGKLIEGEREMWVNIDFNALSSGYISSFVSGYEYRAPNMPYFYLRYMEGRGHLKFTDGVLTASGVSLAVDGGAAMMSWDMVVRGGWNFSVGRHQRTSVTPFFGASYYYILGDGHAAVQGYGEADLILKLRALKPCLGMYIERRVFSWLDIGLIPQYNYIIYDRDEFVLKGIPFGPHQIVKNIRSDFQFTFEVPLTFHVGNKWDIQLILYDPDVFGDDGKAWRARMEIRRHF
jgi:hypothetical protein